MQKKEYVLHAQLLGGWEEKISLGSVEGMRSSLEDGYLTWRMGGGGPGSEGGGDHDGREVSGVRKS